MRRDKKDCKKKRELDPSSYKNFTSPFDKMETGLYVYIEDLQETKPLGLRLLGYFLGQKLGRSFQAIRIGEDDKAKAYRHLYVILASKLLRFGASEIAFRLKRKRSDIIQMRLRAEKALENPTKFSIIYREIVTQLREGATIQIDPDWSD